jgi:hypothetical protein
MRRSSVPMIVILWLIAGTYSQDANASGGLVVKLRDGSTPINQPDLIASALSKAWGDGSQFCAALKALLQYAANGVVNSCTAQPFGITRVGMPGRTPVVSFSDNVTLQGTSTQQHDKICAFTDTLNVLLEAPLNNHQLADHGDRGYLVRTGHGHRIPLQGGTGANRAPTYWETIHPAAPRMPL